MKKPPPWDYKIRSIIRPSDNQTFSTGDALCMKHDSQKPYADGKPLTNIWISGEQIRGDIGRLGVVLYTPEHEDIFDVFKSEL